MLSVHVMHPINTPEMCIELRTIVSDSSALTNELSGPEIQLLPNEIVSSIIILNKEGYKFKGTKCIII